MPWVRACVLHTWFLVLLTNIFHLEFSILWKCLIIICCLLFISKCFILCSSKHVHTFESRNFRFSDSHYWINDRRIHHHCHCVCMYITVCVCIKCESICTAKPNASMRETMTTKICVLFLNIISKYLITFNFILINGNPNRRTLAEIYPTWITTTVFAWLVYANGVLYLFY